MPRLTVFTPAYNRAHTLPRTYESLRSQSCKDFIWLIVDDGSRDQTRELVQSWQAQDNGFEIRYIYKENGGMHTAHNTAYENITTELNVCIDSDDAMAPGGVEKLLTAWERVRHKNYAGLIALDGDMHTGAVIGKGFPQGLEETTLSGYYARGGAGDKKLVYRTEVMNRYPPYPVFPGEKYVALAYKYHLADRDYQLSVLNEVLCLVDYQNDGHTTGMWKEYRRSPRGFALWRRQCMEQPRSKKRLVVDCVHYCASCILGKEKDFVKTSPKKLLTVLCVPAGLLLAQVVKMKTRPARKE